MKPKPYRNRFRMVTDVLRFLVMEGSANVARISLYSNVCHQTTIEIMEELLQREIVTLKRENNKKIFTVTQKGRDYYRAYIDFKDFSESVCGTSP